MEDKEMIEEMAIAKMIQKYLSNNNITVSHSLLPLHIEDMLIRNNYRKIPEDGVVLSGKQCVEIVQDNYNIGYERGSKETAKEILSYLIESGVVNTAPETIKMYFKENYGVEVEE